jgi:antitoxin HicB
MAERNVNDYLALPYHIEVVYDTSGEQPGWFARVLELPGCITQADTFEELGEMIKDAMRVWIETALEDGQPVPEPHIDEDYSGKFVLRLPRSFHRELAEAAERDGVSLNALINSLLGRALGGQPTYELKEQADTGWPKPVWPRLSDAARRAMLAAGCEVEAQEVGEALFANWLEKIIEQAEAATEGGYVQDAAWHLEQCCTVLLPIREVSPLMGVLYKSLCLLRSQVEQVKQLREGILNQALIQSRISAQVQTNLPPITAPTQVYIGSVRESVDQSLLAQVLRIATRSER